VLSGSPNRAAGRISWWGRTRLWRGTRGTRGRCFSCSLWHPDSPWLCPAVTIHVVFRSTCRLSGSCTSTDVAIGTVAMRYIIGPTAHRVGHTLARVKSQLPAWGLAACGRSSVAAIITPGVHCVLIGFPSCEPPLTLRAAHCLYIQSRARPA
jgi:hypothetical protein